MIYANVATGFKSPAFNTSLVGPGGAAPADPEKNTNFEIGMKAETADHKLQGSIVAFYTDYRNNQTLTIPPGAFTTVIYNLPQATINGIEEIGIATCRESVCQYGELSVFAVSLKQKINPKHK